MQVLKQREANHLDPTRTSATEEYHRIIYIFINQDLIDNKHTING